MTDSDGRLDSGGPLPVRVVGGGISGVACARALADAGVPVVVWDRARRVGGRLAVRTVDNRPVDVGASYFTVSDPAFQAVTDSWTARGLARPWADTFAVADPDGLTGTTTGPVRYAAPGGMRALVGDLAEGVYVEYGNEAESVDPGPHLDRLPAAAVVLAMPDPQAADLLGDGLPEEEALVAGRDWEPTLTLYAGWEQRSWPEVDGVFVNDSPVLAWIADDGRRRGDAAPVLVAHSTGEFAAAHLDLPRSGIDEMLTAVCRVLGISSDPAWAGVQRWSLSRPTRPHPEPYHLGAAGIGLCGDGWTGRPRVEAAYLSGRALGRQLATALS